MRTLRFWLGNLLAAYAVVHYGETLIRLDLPVRLRLTLPVALIAVWFSLLIQFSARWWPDRLKWRSTPILLLAVLAVALGGAGAALLQPLVSAADGALIALSAFYHSPLVSGPALLFALLWSHTNFPPPPPELPPEERPQPADWEILAGGQTEWIGGGR